MIEQNFLDHLSGQLGQHQDIARSIMESISDVVFFVSLAGTIEYVSPSGKRNLGYTESDIIGKPFESFIHPDDIPACRDAYEKIANDGISIDNIEHRIATKGFGYRWYLTNAAPVKDREGNIIFGQGISRDITDRKTAEFKLIEAENYYKGLIENSLDAILVLDENVKIKYESPAFKAMTGYSAAEGTFEDLYLPVHPDDVSIAESGLAEMAANGPGVLAKRELRIQHKEGSWLTIQVVANNLLGDPAVNGYVIHIRNLTARRQAEKALQHQSDFERLIMNLSAQFINLETRKVDEGLDVALKEIGEFTRVDRSYIFQFSEDGKTISNTHEWCAPGIEPQIEFLQEMPSDDNNWMMDQVFAKEIVFIPDIASMPEEAAVEKELLQAQDIQSMVMVPIVCGGTLLGTLGFDSVRGETEWTEKTTHILRLVGEMIGNVLMRRRSDDLLHEARQELERKVEERTAELVESNRQLEDEIIKQRESEDQLRKSEQKYRSLVESIEGIGEIIFHQSLPDFSFQYISPSIEEILGYPIDNYYNDPLFYQKIAAADFADFFARIREGLFQGKMAPFTEFKLISSSGQERWFTQSNVGLYDDAGNLIGIEGVCRDITQRKMAEEALRNSEILFRSIIENTHDIFVLVSAEGTVLYESPSIERVLGYTAEERLSRSFKEIIHPDDLQTGIDNLIAVAANPGAVQPVLIRIKHKDGTYRHIEGILKNCLDLPGVEAIICNYRDVTERYLAEMQLKHYAEELTRTNEELSQYAQVVCHDLCAPLRAIRMYTHLLRHDIYNQSLEDSVVHLNTIENAVLEGQQMAQDLLDFGQMHEGSLDYEPIHMSKLLSDTIALFDVTPDVKITKLNKKWPVIESSPILLRQIFINVIDNAIKFNNSTEKKVELGYTRINGEGYEFSIRDNGYGIPQKNQERIFQIFSQLHPKGKYEGRGMGLAIVKKAVGEIGGRVRIISEPGKGSTFYIFVPSKSS